MVFKSKMGIFKKVGRKDEAQKNSLYLLIVGPLFYYNNMPHFRGHMELFTHNQAIVLFQF